MEENLNNSGGEPFLEHSWVLLAQQEHMLLIELAGRLLGHFQRLKLLLVNEFDPREDWLKFRL